MNNEIKFIAEYTSEKIEPTMYLSPEQLQEFAEELSRVGYKPEKGFVQGKLDATEKHLEDMRTLLKLK